MRIFKKFFFLAFSGLLTSLLFSAASMEKLRDKWPENPAESSLKELNDLQQYCSRMVEYEDLMLEESTWKKRLEQIEILQKKNYGQQESKREEDSKPVNSDSYKIRRIYINNKNPSFLDLHGVSSAKEAKDKVFQFIKAAKSKRKNEVVVITGKGNHVNRQGKRGILLKSFPKWLEGNENVTALKARSDGGSYTVFLKSRFNGRLDVGLEPYLRPLKGDFFYLQKLLGENLNYMEKPLPQKILVVKEKFQKLPKNPSKKGKKRQKQFHTSQQELDLSEFPSIISHKKAKKWLDKFCKTLSTEEPVYSLASQLDESMKTVCVTIKGLGRSTYQIEAKKKGYQNFLAQEVYKQITGLSASKKQAKDLLQKICQKKGLGAPEYQMLNRQFRVKVSVRDVEQEEISLLSQVDAENRAAKKMYELLREFPEKIILLNQAFPTHHF
jgi:hypothetical protein